MNEGELIGTALLIIGMACLIAAFVMVLYEQLKEKIERLKR